MTLSRRVASLERASGPPGVCGCPGSIQVVHVNDRRGNPLEVPPPRACGACGGPVRRIEVRYEKRPMAGAMPAR